jgi:hypothetical protein
MIDPLHVGILIPTAIGLCCTVGDRRSRSVALWLPAGVMGLAMFDMALGLGLLPALGWAAVLVLLSLAGAMRHRLSRAAWPVAGRHAAGMMIHRSGGLILMAVLLLAMETGRAGTSLRRSAHDHGGATGMLAVLAVTGTIVFIAGTGILTSKLLRRNSNRDVLTGVEAGSMGLSVGLMGLAAFA